MIVDLDAVRADLAAQLVEQAVLVRVSASVGMASEMQSMPLGVCATGMLLFSKTSRMARSVPTAPERPFFDTVTMEKSHFPAMPVTKRSGFGASTKLSVMSVPGWSGSFVLRMLGGRFFSRTGKIVISCSTCAPL